MEQKQVGAKMVLVVDDEPIIVKACQRTLAKNLFQTDTAPNGEKALELLREKRYDLCISDILMPKMNGIELFQQLRQESHDITDRFIFITGNLLTGEIKTFLEETRRPYLLKPFSLDELRELVRINLEKV